MRGQIMGMESMRNLFFKTLFLFLVGNFCILFFSAHPIIGSEQKGSVQGTVRYSGTISPRESSPVKTDPEVCGAIYLEEPLVNSENKGVKNAVISLKKKSDETKPSDAKERSHVISKNCRLDPYISAIPIHESLRFQNSDPILHVLQFSRNDQVLFNLPLPPNGTFIKKFDQTGPMEVKCVIHPFMKSFILVLDTPHYIFSDMNGFFHFPEIEPGKYNFSIWHKSFGSLEKEIEITSGKSLDLSFELEQR